MLAQSCKFVRIHYILKTLPTSDATIQTSEGGNLVSNQI